MTDLKILELRGKEAMPYVDRLAAVRSRVFRDFPYLYDGDVEYERRYLNTYFSSAHSFIVLVLDGEKVVGASTAIWLPDGEEAFQKPFLDRGIPLKEVCYYGESVLLSEYRGRKLGQEFMSRREKFARSLPGVTIAAFCAVQRPPNHPLGPTDYRPLYEFWKKCGFVPQENMIAHYSWKDVGDSAETEKPLRFWLKKL